MEYRYVPDRAGPCHEQARRYLFFLLTALFFYGCASVEKPPPDNTFVQQRARSVRERADLAYGEGDYQGALLMFRKALEIDRRILLPDGEVSDLIGMGRSYTGLGKWEPANRYLTKAVKKAFSERDDKGLSMAYAALAESYLKSHRYGPALGNVNDAISLARAGGRESVELYNLAALIYLTTGRLDEAGAMIESAIKAATPDSSPSSTALSNTYRLKARILSKEGDISEAMSYFDRAYALDAGAGDEKKMALDLWSAAVVLIDSGRYNEAIIQLKKSYLLYRKYGLLDEAIRNLDKLVEVYLALGDKKSERYYRNMREAVLTDMR